MGPSFACEIVQRLSAKLLPKAAQLEAQRGGGLSRGYVDPRVGKCHPTLSKDGPSSLWSLCCLDQRLSVRCAHPKYCFGGARFGRAPPRDNHSHGSTFNKRPRSTLVVLLCKWRSTPKDCCFPFVGQPSWDPAGISWGVKEVARVVQACRGWHRLNRAIRGLSSLVVALLINRMTRLGIWRRPRATALTFASHLRSSEALRLCQDQVVFRCEWQGHRQVWSILLHRQEWGTSSKNERVRREVFGRTA